MSWYLVKAYNVHRRLMKWEMDGAYLSQPASVSIWLLRVSQGAARSAEEASLSVAGALPVFASNHLQRPDGLQIHSKIRDADQSVICLFFLLF